MHTIYKSNLEPIMSTWGSHRADFDFLETNVIYGLFLADHSVLDQVEAEIVTLCSIMCQGLKGPTMWHLRGLLRMDVAREDVESMKRATMMVADWCGKSTEGWAELEEINDV